MGDGDSSLRGFVQTRKKEKDDDNTNRNDQRETGSGLLHLRHRRDRRQEGEQARRRRLRPQEGDWLQLPHQRQTLRSISAKAESRSSNRSTSSNRGGERVSAFFLLQKEVIMRYEIQHYTIFYGWVNTWAYAEAD